MKCALIGLGRISKKHQECLIALRNELELVVICDREQKNVDEFIFSYREKTGKSPSSTNCFEDILKYDIDLAIITTDTGSHYKITKRFLKNKIPCLVEKPLALNGKQCKKLECIAKKNQLVCGVFFQNRNNPAIRYLKQAISEGRFGKISHISGSMLWHRNRGYYANGAWRGKWKTDGGAFFNQAIHCVDIVQWLADSKVSNIFCRLSNRLHPYIEVEDYGLMSIQFENNIVASVEATVNCTKDIEETICVVGERGFVKIGGVAMNKIEEWEFTDERDYDRLVFNKANTEVKDLYGSGHICVYKNFLNDFKNRSKLLVDFKEASSAVNIILTAYKSFKQQKCLKYKENLNTSIMTNEILYRGEK